jgi:hypothetical protein
MILFFSGMDDSHIHLEKLWRLGIDLLITFSELRPDRKDTIYKQTQEMLNQYKELRRRQ